MAIQSANAEIKKDPRHKIMVDKISKKSGYSREQVNKKIMQLMSS